MNKITWLHATFLSLALAACGGGSDGGPDPEPPPPPPPPLTLPQVAGGTAHLLAGSLDAQCGHVGSAGAMTFHKGALWLADTGCQAGEGARVQVFDAGTGAASTFAAVPARQPGDTKARGFGYPTGIAFDRQDRLFVMDGAHPVSKWGTSLSALPTPSPGFGSGIWRVTAQGVSVFAGVALNTAVDGAGEAAGFVLANGLAIDADGNFYTQDVHKLRRIAPDATVTTLDGWLLQGAPVLDAGGRKVYGFREVAGVGELFDLASDAVLTTVPAPGFLVLMDAQDNIYAATTAGANSPDPKVVYRRARGGAQFEPVVTDVRYLNAMAVDDAGNLYLHQRNAIVKVAFAR